MLDVDLDRPDPVAAVEVTGDADLDAVAAPLQLDGVGTLAMAAKVGDDIRAVFHLPDVGEGLGGMAVVFDDPGAGM